MKQKTAKKEHPVSEAQRRWAFAAEAEGKLPKGKARDWSRRVKGEKLPAHTAKSLDPIDSLVKGDDKGRAVTQADALRAAKRFGIRWDRARFSLADLRAGMQVELEHTANKMRAADIAIDHLVERHGYYNRLREMEGDEAPDTTRAQVTTRPDMVKGHDMTDPIDALAKAFPPKKKPQQPADPYAQQDQDYGDDTSGNFDDGDSETEVDDDGAGEDDNEYQDEGAEDGDADADGVPDEADLDDDGDGQPDMSGEGAGEDEFGEQEGDLEDDGQPGDPNDAIAKLAALERDYYAAKGMHGAGHHKTEALLDQYHRAVRELVRDVAGGQSMPQQGAQLPGQDDADDDGVPDDQDDADGIDADGDGSDDDTESPFPPKQQGKPPAQKPTAFGGGTKPSPKPMQGKGAFGGKPQGKPAPKKKPPFGKSMIKGHRASLVVIDDPIDALAAKSMRKSVYDFASSDNEISSQFLMPYLVAFIEAAYGVAAAEQPNARYSPEDMSCAVMCKLVAMMPKNKNLNAAATKYKVTAEGIAKILKDRGIISSEEAEASRAGLTGEEGALEAMGAGGIGGEVFTTKSWFDVDERDPLLKGAPGVRVNPQVMQRAANIMLRDDTVDPGAALAKAQRALVPSFMRADEQLRVNIDGACLIHGHADLTKSQNLWNPHARCTCPKH